MDHDQFQTLEKAGFTVSPLENRFLADVCRIEAEAFNKLRETWGQPFQHPRRIEWLAFQAEHFPENTMILQKESSVVGFIMVHQWGTLGWMGPVVIDPDLQGSGLGRSLVSWSLAWMQSLRCRTIGLETWSYNLTNVGLYIKTGFDIGPIICVVDKKNPLETSLSGTMVQTRDEFVPLKRGFSRLGNEIAEGLDYSPLAENILAAGLGTVCYWGSVDDPAAAAIIRTEAYTEGPTQTFANVDVLAVKSEYRSQLDLYLSDLEHLAALEGKTSLRLSVPGEDPDGLRTLLGEKRFRLLKTRLRMYARKQLEKTGAVNYLSYSV